MPQGHALFWELTVDDALQVAVELGAQRPVREPPERGEAAGEDLGDVVAEYDVGAAGDGGALTREQLGEAH